MVVVVVVLFLAALIVSNVSVAPLVSPTIGIVLRFLNIRLVYGLLAMDVRLHMSIMWLSILVVLVLCAWYVGRSLPVPLHWKYIISLIWLLVVLILMLMSPLYIGAVIVLLRLVFISFVI